jgi:hypothetical protein
VTTGSASRLSAALVDDGSSAAAERVLGSGVSFIMEGVAVARSVLARSSSTSSDTASVSTVCGTQADNTKTRHKMTPKYVIKCWDRNISFPPEHHESTPAYSVDVKQDKKVPKDRSNPQRSLVPSLPSVLYCRR